MIKVDHRRPLEQDEFDQALEQLLAHVGEDTFKDLFAMGQEMSIEAAIGLAQAVEIPTKDSLLRE